MMFDKNGLFEHEHENPISNLPYISKLVERAVAKQLTSNLDTNDLFEPLQSAYQSKHSTETALLYILNDLFVALDSHSQILVSLLDCSVAFDPVYYSILLHHLNSHLGLSGIPLDWPRSYLSDRTQCAALSGHKSAFHPLTCGIPQGSVLGPTLFMIYALPLGDIIRSHHAGYHLYADDTQRYLA